MGFAYAVGASSCLGLTQPMCHDLGKFFQGDQAIDLYGITSSEAGSRGRRRGARGSGIVVLELHARPQKRTLVFGAQTLTPRSVPVSIFETPPLEINLLRKASSLLRNVSRASANPVTPRLCLELPNLLGRECFSSVSSPESLVRGSGGAFVPPEPVPHQMEVHLRTG